MATGLRVPVGVGQDGKAAVESDDDQLAKALRLALSPGDDDNAFQQLGIPESLVFSVNDAGTAGVIRQTVRKILAKFNDRLELQPGTIIQLLQKNEGELEVQFTYINTETNDVKDFVLQLP
jgi:hypothetical protein